MCKQRFFLHYLTILRYKDDSNLTTFEKIKALQNVGVIITKHPEPNICQFYFFISNFKPVNP